VKGQGVPRVAELKTQRGKPREDEENGKSLARPAREERRQKM
jgi:hypothetical protein